MVHSSFSIRVDNKAEAPNLRPYHFDRQSRRQNCYRRWSLGRSKSDKSQLSVLIPLSITTTTDIHQDSQEHIDVPSTTIMQLIHLAFAMLFAGAFSKPFVAENGMSKRVSNRELFVIDCTDPGLTACEESYPACGSFSVLLLPRRSGQRWLVRFIEQLLLQLWHTFACRRGLQPLRFFMHRERRRTWLQQEVDRWYALQVRSIHQQLTEKVGISKNIAKSASQ